MNSTLAAERSLTDGEEKYLKYHHRRYEATLRHLPEQKGRLLDAGCFPGHLAILAKADGWDVAGVSLSGERGGDPSFECRMEEAGIDVRILDVERHVFPFGDNSFDVCLFNETIEHLPFNPFHPLSEIWRVLKPGGLMIFSVPNFACFDHRWALLRGRSFHHLLNEQMSVVFPSDISHRHNREYTRNEVRYLLSEQDKYLYRFDVEKIIMDRSMDGMFWGEGGRSVSLRRIRPGTLLRDLLTRAWPNLRRNIFVRARKPTDYIRVGADKIHHEGFLDEEETGAGDSFLRNPILCRWMQTKAQIAVDVPPGHVDFIDLLTVLPAPESLPPVALTFSVNGEVLASHAVTSSLEPRRLRIPLPVNAQRPVTIQLRAEQWTPADFGIPDNRRLGAMICLEEIAAGLDVTPSS
ncbi:MAG: class I SAM-dependent methyltransferase [Verrucomicrobia bacterium]|nr:class I SAM-dependent methyltransferase [Verrucomicrobiota bacterium]